MKLFNYIGFEQSQIERPLKLLKGFSRIRLEPDEIKTVTIEVPHKNLSWYNPESKSWEVEPIIYKLFVGSSSKMEDLLSSQFTKK